MKKYTIGDEEFTLAPLTWKQKKLATPFEQKVRQKIVELSRLTTPEKIDSSRLEKTVADLFTITVEVDSLLYGDDAPIRFLATILSKVGDNDLVEVWTEKSIEENVETLQNVTEDQFGEIMQDFFTRAKKQLPGSTSSSLRSSTSSEPSIVN